ncbi:MAG: G1 family glutamic endopeptidase [Solirubrobacteraceae bacterium]
MAVTVCIAVTLAGCGASQAPHRHDTGPATTSTTGTETTAADTAGGTLHPNLGPFAGYAWNGDVDSAHADWTVPRLLPSSVRGEAATWIGAEAPGARKAAPFVQVGVNEGDADGAGAAFYYAFYSTTKLHFHPVHLFDVSPGDQISATLRRHGARWQIRFTDGTAGRQRQLSVAEGAGRRFNEAQYTQEDVTDAGTGRPFPYPSLSPVRFTAIAADGMTPRPARLTASWLTEADGYLAPGPLHDGGFTLAHAEMTSAGLRYLRAIAAQDHATVRVTAQLLHWAQGGPARPAVVATRRFADVLRATVTTLREERWPGGAHAAISALRSDTRALIALLSTIRTVNIVERTAWAVRFDRLTEMVGVDGQAARRALRLPSLTVASAVG